MVVNEQDIAQLQSMGFSASQARECLVAANGNMEIAINYLLSGGPPPPAPAPARAPAGAKSTGDEGSTSSGDIIGCHMSQYSVPEGRSACTCIALAAASNFLQHQYVDADFLVNMIGTGVQNYQTLQSDSGGGSIEHMSGEEVMQKDRMGLFKVKGAGSGGVRQGILSNDMDHPLGLKSLLQGLRHEQHHSEWMAILMTKTPETVLLCFSPDSVSPPSYWLIDSHPRPQFGVDSAYAKMHPTLDSLLLTLQAIFPATDLGPDIPEMMAMMYNSFDLYPLMKA